MSGQHPPEFHKVLSIKPDDERTPAEVIRDFTKAWVDGLSGLMDQINELMAKAEAIVTEQVALAVWEDDGGPCR